MRPPCPTTNARVFDRALRRVACTARSDRTTARGICRSRQRGRVPLSAGVRLGAYEVVAPLGAGGMGEVYRARDTRLGRDVAIKVLPENVAADAERRARLDREARTLASLNHPNIAHIYGIEDS